jgi:dihydroxyacetone kinase
VHAGGGILFCYNNYAGDVLNFDEAQRRLRALGIDVRTVVVTDDIASAPPTEPHRRRGIAGSLAVFKAAGWACDSGASLDEVVRIASMANERVRTLGVAFSGCTLPGASAPLFTVEKGRMEVGMGIHGEPGLRSIAAPSAHGLAQQFVTELLADVPSVVRTIKGSRVAVILNGLGAVKYEELFVIYRSVDRLLAERGLTIVEPEVGEMVTSFDMAGVSLSLVWLDEELERSWTAASDTPAFRKGSVAPSNGELAETALRRTTRVLKPGSDASRAAAAVALEALHDASRVIAAASDELGRLDAVAGDGDHGIGMQRGLAAAVEAAEQALAAGVGVGTLLVTAGDAWAHRAGGTSGALWGVLLHQLGDALEHGHHARDFDGRALGVDLRDIHPARGQGLVQRQQTFQTAQPAPQQEADGRQAQHEAGQSGADQQHRQGADERTEKKRDSRVRQRHNLAKNVFCAAVHRRHGCHAGSQRTSRCVERGDGVRTP